MAASGALGSLVPAGEDAAVRKIADMQRELRELGPSVAASFASTVADLTTQQEYLASLVTLSTSDEAVAWGPGIGVTFQESGAAISIELAEPRIARVTYTAQVFTAPRGGTATSSGSFYVGAVALNGVQIGATSSAGAEGDVGTSNTIEVPYVCDRIVSLAAGANILSHKYRTYAYATAPGTAEGDRSAGTLVVQIIGRP